MFDIFNTVNEEYVANERAGSHSPSQPPQGVSSDLFVVSIGGSLVIDENGPNAEKIRAIANAISSLHSAGKKFVLVVGGGKTARSYVEAMSSFTSNNFDLDIMGIHMTRGNAMLFSSALPSAHKEVLNDFSKAREILDTGKIPVYGGHLPFFTTDSVGALLAEHLNATFVNLTNVDGIYDSDPAENPDAKRFDQISYQRLVSLLVAGGSKPGQNVVLDLACCLILQRSKIPAAVLNGNDMTNFSNYVNGYSFAGTLIKELEGDVDEAHFIDEMEKINTDIPQKKPRRKPKKKGEKYVPPNPYHIDF